MAHYEVPFFLLVLLAGSCFASIKVNGVLVTIQNEKFPKLAKQTLARYHNAQSITIVSSDVKDIEEGAFNGTVAVEKITINRNPLQKIRAGVFHSSKLKLLDLKDNKISSIEDGAFGCENLKFLLLDNNQLTTWSSTWFVKMHKLEHISATFNAIKELGAASFSFALSVGILDFSHNELRRVYRNSFKTLASIKKLDLRGNMLKDMVPGMFNGVKFIETLDLEDNAITEFNQKLSKYIVISNLDLQRNQLKCLPFGVVRELEVKSLNLDHNPFTCVCVDLWKIWMNHPYHQNLVSLNDVRAHCV